MANNLGESEEQLIVFESTHQAMKVEEWVLGQGLKARLIPTPESISASCGLALRIEAQDLKQIVQGLEAIELVNLCVYQAQTLGGKKSFKKLNSL